MSLRKSYFVLNKIPYVRKNEEEESSAVGGNRKHEWNYFPIQFNGVFIHYLKLNYPTNFYDFWFFNMQFDYYINELVFH